MTTEAIDKQFQIYARPQIDANTTKTYTLNEDGSLTIEGIASTTNKDLQDDIVTPTAIESMKKQIRNGLNLHGDHYYGLFEGVIGAIKEVIETDAYSLRIKAVILPKYAQTIKEMLDVGVKLGLSIGGRVTEYTQLDDGGWEIKDITLREISLTSMPANWDTYGTITTSKGVVKSTCLTGACYTIMKNEVKNMTQKNNGEETEILTKQDVIDLINEQAVIMKEDLLNDTVNIVSKQLEKIVSDSIKDALKGNNNEEEGEEGEETEEKSLSLNDIKSLFQSELDSMKSELKELIPEVNVSESVNKAVSEEMSKLFKDLNSQRDPDFRFKQENPGEDPVNNDATKTEFTSQEIAEMLVAKQSREDFLKSLL